MPAGGSAALAVSAPVEPTSLELFLQPLRPLLDGADVHEICINRPGEAFVERAVGWTREVLGFASYDWCHALAKLVANHTRQRVSASEPLLSATLPSGERIQVVLPPATEPNTVSITIRRPAQELWTLQQLRELAVFDTTRVGPTQRAMPESADATLSADEQRLLARLAARDFVSFLRDAVQSRRNILLSGATGSGKTTLAKALILEVPAEERIVTIEDARELSLQNQPNHVRLFYSQGGQGLAAVSPGELLACTKRQRPDRVFVSEMRTGDEVYDCLVSINTGHPGSICSVHADSAAMAFVALAQMLKRSDAGRGMSTREGVELAQLSVDVVVQCARRPASAVTQRRHHVSEVWYDPSAKRRSMA
jgi:type IV secretion system protein VirB11